MNNQYKMCWFQNLISIVISISVDTLGRGNQKAQCSQFDTAVKTYAYHVLVRKWLLEQVLLRTN